VALSLWGLGTMGEPLDDLPDTVVSKRSRHSTAAPSSAGKTPSEYPAGWRGLGRALPCCWPALITVGCGWTLQCEPVPSVLDKQLYLIRRFPTPAVRSALRELLAAASPAISGCPQGTPGAMGPAAPASTPATGAAPAADRADGLLSGLVVDPATLAAKLTEMAEQHDVTLEVPLVRLGRPGS
jgi:hypothetical protein